MIQVKELTKTYGTTTVVDRVSFEVEEGDILGFLGPNGAGKTTTMRMLTCYMPPTSGTATVAGFDIFENSLKVRQSIGYMPEGVPSYHDMTVRSYLGFVAEVKGVRAGLRKKAVEEAIERTGLGINAHRLIHNLSKGYKQRVGLAQAIINQPKVLVLDEPTSGLDPRQIIEIRKLIHDLAQTSTIILSTHILPEVNASCNKVVIINKGRVAAFGGTDEILTSVGDAFEVEVTVEGPEDEILRVLRALSGVQTVSKRMASQGATHFLSIIATEGEDPRRDIATTLVKSGWGLIDLHSKMATLEDVFVRIISSDISQHLEEEEYEEDGSSDSPELEDDILDQEK